ncbi:MAG: Rab family GTPase [Promethearchaeia archaeon]
MAADITYKIIIGGEGAVGKTTLLKRFVEGFFVENTQMTIGVQIHKKTLTIGNNFSCDLQLWDLGGQERFRTFLDSFVRGSKGALLLFDLTRRKTIEKIDHWVDIIRKYDPTVPILLIGAKHDLIDMRSVSKSDIDNLIEQHQFIGYMPTSAKTGLNAQIAFETLTSHLLKKNNILQKLGIEV